MDMDYMINDKGEITNFSFSVPPIQSVLTVKNALHYIGLQSILFDCVKKIELGEYGMVEQDDYDRAMDCVNLLAALWLDCEVIDKDTVDKILHGECKFNSQHYNAKNKNVLSLFQNACNLLLILLN